MIPKICGFEPVTTHYFADVLTSKVFHTVSKCTSIILEVKEVQCVLCAHYYVSLTTLITELRTEKS
jgi:hypothetical protein